MSRNRFLRIPVTEAEHAEAHRRAGEDGRAFAVWARERLLGDAAEPDAPDGPKPRADDRIRELYTQGLTPTEIAREVGLTPDGVRRALRRISR